MKLQETFVFEAVMVAGGCMALPLTQIVTCKVYSKLSMYSTQYITEKKTNILFSILSSYNFKHYKNKLIICNGGSWNSG